MQSGRPCVLVFAGADPCGGAGIAADVLAIAAQGAHALPVVTALTVQDNDRVFDVMPVDADVVRRQAQALIDKVDIAAVKIGIPGSAANARVIAELLVMLRQSQPGLPVVLDPVLASGHGDTLSRGDAVQALAPLLALCTLLVPNLPEAAALSGQASVPEEGAGHARALQRQAAHLQARGCLHVLVTGGHGTGKRVINSWFGPGEMRQWSWPRLPGEFHGSGCTLASAIAARLALGEPMALALERGQAYCQQVLAAAFPIAAGQLIPQRIPTSHGEDA
jgi:hydroxymethylpyrimidine/phosphomethylpyrimidine kinase